MSIRRRRLNIIFILCLVILSIISISIGVEKFSIINLIKGNEHDVNIFLISRLPRVAAVIITGASLSIAGLIMQSITANKFVSPTTAGTMQWARLGILIVIFFANSANSFLKILIAFVVSLLGTFIFIFILRNTKLRNSIIIPLIGIMIGNVVSSITTYFAYRFDLIQNISSWLMGSFTLVSKGNYELLYFGIPFLILAYLYASKFTIASMGEDMSKNLGLNYNLIVTIGLIIVSIITSIVLVTVGSIMFVGLIVPNIVSMYHGDNMKDTLFETAIIGSILILITDILSRVIIFPYEVSISVILSVVGSLIFLIIIFRKNKVKSW